MEQTEKRYFNNKLQSLSSPIWWSWDHSTNWILNKPGKQTYGASNYYGKNPKSFWEDYKRAICWAKVHGIDAIGIAGLLRDSHGGLEAAKKIVCLAKEGGVRIYAIVGLISYGGLYYEGDSSWSLEKFLKQNPDCLAITENGKPLIKNFGMCGPRLTSHGCPSNPKLMDFVLRSVEGLLCSIPELGGMQFETGDTGVCRCKKCRKRRKLPSGDLSLDDMALFYPRVAETIFSVNPDAWAICETYGHFLQSKTDPIKFGYGLSKEGVEMLSVIPKEVFLQWVCDEWMVDEWPKIPLPHHTHIMRAHFGTYWMGSSRHCLEVKKIQRMCRFSALSGISRVSLFGESASYHSNNEFNYLAQVYFSRYPDATMDDFIRDEMADRLGGIDKAADYLKWNEKTNENVVKGIVSHVHETDSDAQRRWLWLGSYLGALNWDKIQSDQV